MPALRETAFNGVPGTQPGRGGGFSTCSREGTPPHNPRPGASRLWEAVSLPEPLPAGNRRPETPPAARAPGAVGDEHRSNHRLARPSDRRPGAVAGVAPPAHSPACGGAEPRNPDRRPRGFSDPGPTSWIPGRKAPARRVEVAGIAHPRIALDITCKTVEPAPETAALRRINSPKSARPLMPRWRGDRLALPSLFRPVSCAATGAPMGRRSSPRPPAPSNGPEHGRTGPVGNSSRPPTLNGGPTGPSRRPSACSWCRTHGRPDPGSLP